MAWVIEAGSSGSRGELRAAARLSDRSAGPGTGGRLGSGGRVGAGT